jgi:hypothetical protein
VHFIRKLTGLLTEAGAKAEADERHNRETADENFIVEKVRGAVTAVRCRTINHNNRRKTS